MFRSLFSRRGGVAVAAATIGVASMSLAFAGTAGATAYPDTPGSASLIVGSGSQTSYATMTALTDLFNGSPGCDLTASGSVPSTLSCGSTSSTAGSSGGEQGFAVAGENPYNDFSVQAPAIGSGNGATALEAAGTGSPTQTIAYSRASAHKGNTTDNDVAYAIDGVSWTTFNLVGGVKTNQAKITDISKTNLSAIWNGTLSCTVSGVTYNMDWKCLGAKASSPIDVYNAQTGSGTYSTWSGALSYSGAAPAGLTCAACEQGWVANGGSAGTIVTAHENLFENQMATIAAQPDAKDAIYFMSYGKFTTTCAGKNGKKVVCANTAANDNVTFGTINGIAATQTSIQAALTTPLTAFPVTRELYNLYNNSSATVPSNQATLNFVGEDGFLCKASTVSDIDPQTGIAYRIEIENAIKAQGFFPLDTNGSTFNEGSPTFPGTLTDAGYTANDVTNTFVSGGVTYSNTGTTNLGYCLVTNG